MMLNTKHFGEIEVNEEQVINFPNGLIALNNLMRFIIIENEDKQVPFDWLQSLNDPNITFVIINPFVFKKDYEFELSQEVKEELEIEKEDDVVILSIVVIPNNIKDMTANLLAPIVINKKAKLGKQIVLLDKRYKTKHNIIEELQNSIQGGV